MTAAELATKLGGKKVGNHYEARCPAHDDHDPSLDITEKDGKTLFKCQAGCPQDRVLAALRKLGVWPEPQRRDDLGPNFDCAYDYRDESGRLVFQKLRWRAPPPKNKTFSMRHPDGVGGWIKGVEGVQWHILYRLPELLAEIAKPDGKPSRIFLVEGEKDVDRLRNDWGVTATTNPEGASEGKSKWRQEYNQYFAGADVVILPDHDAGGFAHTDHVAPQLARVAAQVRVVELPGLGPKGDISDWLDDGGAQGDFEDILDGTTPLIPTADPEDPQPQPEPDNDVSLSALDIAKWQDKPVPQKQWLVPEWIPWRRVTGLYGIGGEGKTLLLQMLLTATALGLPWLGLRVRKGKAVGFFCEDDEDELHERQAAINTFYGCTFTDLAENLRLYDRLGADNMLMTFDVGKGGRLTPLWYALLAQTQDFGAGLVVFDTLADIFAGNEIDRSQVRQFGQVAMGGFARAISGAVVTSAHSSQAGARSGTGESGSTEWEGVFRSRLYLARAKTEHGEESDQHSRTLYRKKANWALREDKIELRWKDSVFICPVASTGILGKIERRHCRRVFLDFLTDSRPVSANSRAGNYAPKIFSKRSDREHYTRDDFERAMEDLFANKEIHEARYLYDGHPHKKIVPGPEPLPTPDGSKRNGSQPGGPDVRSCSVPGGHD
jgi:RecA-family ATPase